MPPLHPSAKILGSPLEKEGRKKVGSKIPDRSQHDDDIYEDGEVAEQQHPRVLEGLPLQRLEEHSGTIKFYQ